MVWLTQILIQYIHLHTPIDWGVTQKYQSAAVEEKSKYKDKMDAYKGEQRRPASQPRPFYR